MAKDVYESHDEQEAPRDGLGNGLVIVTTLVLLLSIFVIQKAMADKFNAGMLADKAAPAPK